MSLLDKLAIISNELGGMDETAELLGVDTTLIEYALEGGILTRSQQAELQRSYADFELNYQAQQDYALDLDIIDEQAETLRTAEKFINDNDLASDFRYAVSEGLITLDELENGYGLFADLPPKQTEMIINWLVDGNSASGFINAYLNDDNIWDIEDSEFWEWFRDVFYSD